MLTGASAANAGHNDSRFDVCVGGLDRAPSGAPISGQQVENLHQLGWQSVRQCHLGAMLASSAAGEPKHCHDPRDEQGKLDRSDEFRDRCDRRIQQGRDERQLGHRHEDPDDEEPEDRPPCRNASYPGRIEWVERAVLLTDDGFDEGRPKKSYQDRLRKP
jgi:hypothetical protein